jgi:hypothetical protein
MCVPTWRRASLDVSKIVRLPRGNVLRHEPATPLNHYTLSDQRGDPPGITSRGNGRPGAATRSSDRGLLSHRDQRLADGATAIVIHLVYVRNIFITSHKRWAT